MAAVKATLERGAGVAASTRSAQVQTPALPQAVMTACQTRLQAGASAALGVPGTRLSSASAAAHWPAAPHAAT